MSKKNQSPKRKKQSWFYAVRGSYLPCSWQGWLLYVPFIIFLMTVLQMAMQNHDTVSGVFFAVFPQWVAAAVVMTWVAKLQS
jgi:uncharacterized integral membrane protein